MAAPPVAFPASLVARTGKANSRFVGSGYGGSRRLADFLSSLVDNVSDMGVNDVFLTPGDLYMPLPQEEIIRRVPKQIGQSLYREGPGKDLFTPIQKTPIKNFFLAASYTKQDYIASMEGAALSGRQTSTYICDEGEEVVALRKLFAAALESKNACKDAKTKEEELSPVQLCGRSRLRRPVPGNQRSRAIDPSIIAFQSCPGNLRRLQTFSSELL